MALVYAAGTYECSINLLIMMMEKYAKDELHLFANYGLWNSESDLKNFMNLSLFMKFTSFWKNLMFISLFKKCFILNL